MGSTKKFWQGVVIGAVAGGIISLFHRETRHAVIENCKKGAKTVSYYVRNLDELSEQVAETARSLRTTVEQVSEDVSFIAEKVSELKETGASVKELVKDTKDAFLPKEDGDSLPS
ncbi:MAG: YtxH domain-containing protein [Bacillales bacterium]